MAAVAALLSLPSSLTNSYSPIPPLFLIARCVRDRIRALPPPLPPMWCCLTLLLAFHLRRDGCRSGPRWKRRNGRASAPVVCCHCTTPTSMNSFRRRNLLLSGLSSSFALILPISGKIFSSFLTARFLMDSC